MKVEFSKKQKYLSHQWQIEDKTFYIHAQLPFRNQGKLNKPPGYVSCETYNGSDYPSRRMLYSRKGIYNNEQVRDLYRKIADLIPDEESLLYLWEIEKMESLL